MGGLTTWKPGGLQHLMKDDRFFDKRHSSFIPGIDSDSSVCGFLPGKSRLFAMPVNSSGR
jgi:hypothetical protein